MLRTFLECRGLLESMFEWVIPPMLRVAIRMVRGPLPMQDLNLVASCMRLLDAVLVSDFRDKPQTIAEMNDNVQMVCCSIVFAHVAVCCMAMACHKSRLVMFTLL